MLGLILFLIIGLLIAYLAISNSMLVALSLGPYTAENIPLFYVIVGSILIGLILAYAIHLVRSISTSLTIRGKDKKLHATKTEVTQLTKRLHQLELENEKLRSAAHRQPPSVNTL